MKKLFRLIKETIASWHRDKALRQGAALSFYAIVALPAIVGILIGLGGFLLGKDAIQQAVLAQAGDVLGDSGVELVEMLAAGAPNTGTFTLNTVVSVVFLLITATLFFGQLQTSLNSIWNVTPKPGQGVKRIAINKAGLLILSLILALVYFLSIFAELLLSYGAVFLAQVLPFSVALAQWVSLGVSALLFFAIITFIFHLLADVEIRLRDAMVGALVTTLLFTLGKYVIGWYIGQAEVGTAYGAAGSVIALLVWIYYSSQTIFLGAEFTQQYAHMCGKKLKPKTYAMKTNSLWHFIRYRK